MRLLVAILAVLLAAGSAFAVNTWNLTTASNWQSVIQTLPFGTNVVNLAAGTYQCTNGQITVTNGWTTIAGSGTDSCWIVAAPTSRCIAIVGSPLTTWNSLTLRNITFTGGNVTGSGGGASGIDSTHKITAINCAFVSNRATAYGGGAYELLDTQCRYEFNYCTQYGGGAAYCYGISNLARWNTAGQGGGGLYYGRETNSTYCCNTGLSIGGGTREVFLDGCIVVSNWSAAYGGGGSGTAAKDTTFAYNWAPMGGGAWSLTATNCDIHHNRATNTTGGGAANAILLGCRVSNNWAKTTGGGLQDGTADSTLFSDNYSLGNGSAAYLSVLRNCTVVGHTNATTTTVHGQNSEVIANLLMWGNTSNGIAATTNIIACVTNSDPAFIAGTFIPTSTNLVDCGDNTYATYALDARGSNRIVGAAVDVGAYELQASEGASPAAATRRKMMWMLLGE